MRYKIYLPASTLRDIPDNGEINYKLLVVIVGQRLSVLT